MTDAAALDSYLLAALSDAASVDDQDDDYWCCEVCNRGPDECRCDDEPDTEVRGLDDEARDFFEFTDCMEPRR